MDDSPKAPPFALGVEEEFQIVDQHTGELVSGYERLMRRANPEAHAHMKPEFMQCVVECITSVCPDVASVDRETQQLRATASALANDAGMALIAAGTHPSGRWWHQHRTPGGRYAALEERLQDVARSILIYGLHVHVNIDDVNLRIAVMNQARSFLPQILALSVNSPFWMGRQTGYQSFRTMVWASFPMSGVPHAFGNAEEYADFMDFMQAVRSVDGIRRIWWDIRAHEKYPTLEYRIADMPMRHDDTMAIVAFIQALTKTLVTRTLAGQPLPVLPAHLIAENRFRAALAGLHGDLIDYAARREIPMTEAISATLDLISEAAEELALGRYMAHLRLMIAPGYRSGAERQLEAAQKAGERDTARRAVTELLMRETLMGIDRKTALPLLDIVPGDKHDHAAHRRFRWG